MIQLNNNNVFTQLNSQTALFLTIQFRISHLFAPNLNDKQSYFTHRYYHSESDSTWEQ